MGSQHKRIAFTIKEELSFEEAKHKLHALLTHAFGPAYPSRRWTDNRFYVELSNKNIIIQNDDLCEMCLVEEITPFELSVFDVFAPKEVFIYFINDSDSTRGFALSEGGAKRLWFDREQKPEKANAGAPIPEEAFLVELTEGSEGNGPDIRVVYSHPDKKHTMSGLQVIEEVIRGVLLNRYGFDYEWQEFKNGVTLLEAEDFPIEDLSLAFG